MSRRATAAPVIDSGVTKRAIPPSGRAGIHLGRRWGQKLTFPLLLDLGGGPSVLFHLRVHSGVRVQLSPSLYLGLRPIEPTYTVYEDDAAIPVRNGWDVRSSAEVLAEF